VGHQDDPVGAARVLAGGWYVCDSRSDAAHRSLLQEGKARKEFLDGQYLPVSPSILHRGVAPSVHTINERTQRIPPEQKMPKPASASSRRPDHTEGAPKRSALAFKPRSVSGDKGPQRSQARRASADPGARRGDGGKSKRDATSKGPAGKGAPKAKGKFPPGKGKFTPGKGKPAKVDPEVSADALPS